MHSTRARAINRNVSSEKRLCEYNHGRCAPIVFGFDRVAVVSNNRITAVSGRPLPVPHRERASCTRDMMPLWDMRTLGTRVFFLSFQDVVNPKIVDFECLYFAFFDPYSKSDARSNVSVYFDRRVGLTRQKQRFLSSLGIGYYLKLSHDSPRFIKLIYLGNRSRPSFGHTLFNFHAFKLSLNDSRQCKLA